jgi:hypothetical protein
MVFHFSINGIAAGKAQPAHGKKRGLFKPQIASLCFNGGKVTFCVIAINLLLTIYH